MKILIISDIHGNAEALKAIISKETPVDHSIFLGDALLSGPQANETMDLIDELDPTISIMGNHDEEVLHPEHFAHWPEEWIALNEWIIEHLDRNTPEKLAQFKQPGKYDVDGQSIFLHHGDLDKKEGNALPSATQETFLKLDRSSGCPLVFFGHTHVQFSKTIGEQTYINPGSVGQPRTGKLQACYGVIEDGRYSARQVSYQPDKWLSALNAIDPLNSFPKFKEWLKTGLLSGYGIGKNDPWTQFAEQGYN